MSIRSELRTAISQEVEVIHPLDDKERQTQADALTWINSDAELFRLKKPDIPSRHLVSYFIMYDKANESILLVDHRKSGLWLPSGGHVEPDEHPQTTVSRECIEELGTAAIPMFDMPIFITATKTIGQGNHTDVSLWYVLKGTVDMDIRWDIREFKGIRWWKLGAVKAQQTGLDPEMHRFVDKLEQMV